MVSLGMAPVLSSYLYVTITMRKALAYFRCFGKAPNGSHVGMSQSKTVVCRRAELTTVRKENKGLHVSDGYHVIPPIFLRKKNDFGNSMQGNIDNGSSLILNCC